MSTFHVGVPIEKALKLLKKGVNLFEPASPKMVFVELHKKRREGKKFYTGCDNEDLKGLCRGHKD